MSKAKFLRAAPYCDDAMNLPVHDVDAAIPFYETTMGFHLVSRASSPHKSAVLSRDDIQIGIAENGGDPTQEGCFFQVNDVEAAQKEIGGNLKTVQHDGVSYRAFFEIAPDGLCYMIAQPLT